MTIQCSISEIIVINSSVCFSSFFLEKDFLFSMKGSYEESQTLSLRSSQQPAEPLDFHYIKYSLSELRMALAEKKPHFCLVCDH